MGQKEREEEEEEENVKREKEREMLRSIGHQAKKALCRQGGQSIKESLLSSTTQTLVEVRHRSRYVEELSML